MDELFLSFRKFAQQNRIFHLPLIVYQDYDSTNNETDNLVKKLYTVCPVIHWFKMFQKNEYEAYQRKCNFYYNQNIKYSPLHTTMKCSCNHFLLLFTRELDKINSISRNTNCKLGMILWMFHCIKKCITI